MQFRHSISCTNSISNTRLTLALLLAFAGVGSASAATLTVGPGKTFAAPCAAIAAAQDGDTVEISGGNTYTGDVCGVYRNNLTIHGVNGRPIINANGANAMGKGTWVIEGNNVTVDNVEMLGAKVADQNGAALRLEGTGFTLRNSFIHDNENGILSNPNTSSDIVVEYTEFGHNGYGDGYSHNLYIGNNRSLTFRYNFSHDANQGHNLKSRALTNTIVYNRFSSTPPNTTGSTATGSPSYEIDVPNAGTTYVIGNVIEQPAANSNPNMLAYGEEGASNGTQDLYVVNNTFLNDASSGTFVMIGSSVTTPALLQNNVFAGAGSPTNQANAISQTNYAAASPAFVNRAAYDLHPTSSAMIDAGSTPGTAPSGVPLAPVAQYKATAYGEARTVVGAVDIGAYEATSSASPTPTPSWTNCANEGGTCSFSGTAQVRYGANGVYTTITTTGPTACSNDNFGGDPIFGVVKSCSYTPTTSAAPTPSPTTTWTACASENATCNFSGSTQVRYGANGLYVTKTLTGPVACGNSTFGDPAPNVVKSCSYDASATAVTWTSCSGEGASCGFSGTRQVRYGVNGVYVTKSFSATAACTNAAFGTDPVPNVVKACSYSSVTQ